MITVTRHYCETCGRSDTVAELDLAPGVWAFVLAVQMYGVTLPEKFQRGEPVTPEMLIDWAAECIAAIRDDRTLPGRARDQARGSIVDFQADLRRYQHRHGGFTGCAVGYVQDGMKVTP